MFKKLVENRKTNKLRSKLEKSISRSDEAREKDISQMLNLWKSMQARKKHNYDEFFNVCLYSTVVGRDISLLWRNYTMMNNALQKNLFGRLLSMTIIEFLEDINNLLGKKLRLEIQRNKMDEFISDLNTVNKEFSKIKKDYNKELRKIRNNFAAHKTKQAIDLIDFTQQAEIENLHDICSEVTETNTKLTRFTTTIIYKIVDQLKVELEVLKQKGFELDEK